MALDLAVDWVSVKVVKRVAPCAVRKVCTMVGSRVIRLAAGTDAIMVAEMVGAKG